MVTGICESEAPNSYVPNLPNFADLWLERKGRMAAFRDDLIPWNLTVLPTASSRSQLSFPTLATKIASFAVINFLVGLFTLFLGRRTVVQKLTCGFCGKAGSSTWPLVSLLVVGMNLLANYINALLIKRHTGYENVPVWNLVLIWAARPRLAWLGTALVMVQSEQSMYIAMGASGLLSEVIMQGFGAAFIGKTVVFAKHGGFYQVSSLKWIPEKTVALCMYGGALLWVVTVPFFYLYILWLYTSDSKFMNII